MKLKETDYEKKRKLTSQLVTRVTDTVQEGIVLLATLTGKTQTSIAREALYRGLLSLAKEGGLDAALIAKLAEHK